MENKEITITIPEGYEIDKENSTFECIKFKPKGSYTPRSWDEYVRGQKFGTKRYFCDCSIVDNSSSQRTSYEFSTKGEAIAFAALGKLIQLRDAWWGDWRPKLQKYDYFTYSHCICNCLTTRYDEEGHNGVKHILTFPTAEMRDDFYNTFKDLIEEAKMFL